MVEWGLQHLSLIPMHTLLNLLNKRTIVFVMRKYDIKMLNDIIKDLTCFVP